MTQLNATILELPATLDADAAGALIARMSKLSAASEIHLDATAVTAVSPGYLQILISAFKTFPQLSLCNASAELTDAFAGYGIDYPQSASLPGAAAAGIMAAPATKSGAAEMGAVSAPAEASVREPAATLQPMSEPMPIGLPDSGPAPETVAASGPAVAVAGLTILTIDDSRTMRDMLKMALSGAGFTVVQAVDGQDGLNVLAQQPVDVIITDINMPKLDGYGVIRAVRDDPAYNDTPILVLSTEAEQESKDIAKDAGATGWIVKPFDPAGLVNVVNSVCG